jgi:N-acylneuraminate cytidylyltransferase
MKEKTIAIITARGGSKRIPKKNIRNFCGKPIIAYSIEAAKNSGLFSEVMVSTDSEEIAEIARQFGAAVPFFRSAETSGDFATTADVLMEVFEEYEKRGETFSYAACIYPTAPFVTAEKLKAGMTLLEEKHGTMLMPVVAFSFPPQRGVVKQGDFIEFCYPQYRNSRSQDLETIYHDCGQFYCYDVEKYRSVRGQIDGGIIPYMVSELEVQDIDNETDWKLAEMKYRIMREGASYETVP